jgi:hypothetical protein
MQTSCQLQWQSQQLCQRFAKQGQEIFWAFVVAQIFAKDCLEALALRLYFVLCQK